MLAGQFTKHLNELDPRGLLHLEKVARFADAPLFGLLQKPDLGGSHVYTPPHRNHD